MGKHGSNLTSWQQMLLHHVDKNDRLVVQTLWRLDVILRDQALGARDQTLGRIRLQWWIDALATLGDVAQRDPLLMSLAQYFARDDRDALADIARAWQSLLGDEPLTTDDIHRFAVLHGGAMLRSIDRGASGGAGENDPVTICVGLLPLFDGLESSPAIDLVRQVAHQALSASSPKKRRLTGGLRAPAARGGAALCLFARRVAAEGRTAPLSLRTAARMLWHGVSGL